MATPFAETCSVVVNNTYDTTGTVTRSTAGRLNPTELAALYGGTGTWYEMTALLKTQFDMSACGIKRNGLYDWLMSSNKPNMSKLINVEKRQAGPALIQPFILGKQMSVINSDYWQVTAGWTNSDYTSTAGYTKSGTTTNRVIRVTSCYGASLDKNWFRAGHRIIILSSSAAATAQVGQWKVIGSGVATGETSTVDVEIAHEGPSETNVNMAPTANAIVLVGVNNVNDFESYNTLNRATNNPIKYVPFWLQTHRYGRRVDSEYLEVYKKLMEDNAYFAAFIDLPLAEKNRQDEEQRQREFVHSFFFGRAISAKQTLTDWKAVDGLEIINAVSSAAIENPATGTFPMAARANAIGIRDQMVSCGRFFDIQNQKLNIEEWLEHNYTLTRARKSSGKNASEVDWFCSHTIAKMMAEGLFEYVRLKYGDTLRIQVETGSTEFGFNFDRFRIPGYNFAINLVTHEFFDDLADAFTTADSGNGLLAAQGHFLLALDLGKGGSIYPAIIASNRKTRKFGEIETLAKVDKTFAFAMESPTATVTMNSETFTFICECPKNSSWIQGLSVLGTVNTGKSGTAYYDLY